MSLFLNQIKTNAVYVLISHYYSTCFFLPLLLRDVLKYFLGGPSPWSSSSSDRLNTNTLWGMNLIMSPQGNSPRPIIIQIKFWWLLRGQHFTILPPNSTIISWTITVMKTIAINIGFFRMPWNTFISPSSRSLAFS